jgi:hypothetical protein
LRATRLREGSSGNVRERAPFTPERSFVQSLPAPTIPVLASPPRLGEPAHHCPGGAHDGCRVGSSVGWARSRAHSVNLRLRVYLISVHSFWRRLVRI